MSYDVYVTVLRGDHVFRKCVNLRRVTRVTRLPVKTRYRVLHRSAHGYVARSFREFRGAREEFVTGLICGLCVPVAAVEDTSANPDRRTAAARPRSEGRVTTSHDEETCTIHNACETRGATSGDWRPGETGRIGGRRGGQTDFSVTPPPPPGTMRPRRHGTINDRRSRRTRERTNGVRRRSVTDVNTVVYTRCAHRRFYMIISSG